VPLELSALSSLALDELFLLILKAEGYEHPSLVSVWREHEFDEWTTHERTVRWIVERKSGVTLAQLRDTALKLAGARQLMAADRALLMTAETVTSNELRKVLADLQVELWDRPILEGILAEHPEVLEIFEAERARRVGFRAAGWLALRTLSLRNFRGIEAIDLDFEQAGRVLVLHGPNGAGKSAILSALATLLSWLTRRVATPSGKGRGLLPTDLRNGTKEGVASLRADIEGRVVEWSLALGQGPGRTDLTAMSEAASLVRTALESIPDTSIPLAVFYPVNRAVLDIPQRIRHKHDFSQLSAYEGALLGGNRDFRLFFEWFRQREDLENEHRISEPEHRDRQLEAVRLAISALLPGVTNLRIQRKPLRMTVDKRAQELMVDQLSDGEKCLLAMVGDLARRLAIANPSHPRPHQASAVVLIDEIELHLHPAWQREVVPRLLATFPRCQLVVTTHSAPVLGRVDRSSVVLIEDGRIYTESPHTRGRDTSSILSDLMGVSRHPPEVEDRLHRIAVLIDEEQLDAARRAVDELARDLGDDDGEIVRLRTMIDFLE
jgi:predicted ATP-binding protein involved in virulence